MFSKAYLHVSYNPKIESVGQYFEVYAETKTQTNWLKKSRCKYFRDRRIIFDVLYRVIIYKNYLSSGPYYCLFRGIHIQHFSLHKQHTLWKSEHLLMSPTAKLLTIRKKGLKVPIHLG